jgi:hypothetical protein
MIGGRSDASDIFANLMKEVARRIVHDVGKRKVGIGS